MYALGSGFSRQNAIEGGCAGTGNEKREQRSQVEHHELSMVALRTFAEKAK
jgi:hypothetical protein